MLLSQDRLDGLHHWDVGILGAVLLDLIRFRLEVLGIDHGVPALAMVIPTHPNGDEARVDHFVGDELPTGDLRDIEQDLSAGGRTRVSQLPKLDGDERL